MNKNELILGMFYADENNLVYDKINYDENLSLEEKEELRMLSFKFLGPVFLSKTQKWKINFLESSLYLTQEYAFKADTLQSFFSLNSVQETEDGTTNLFTLIGSSYTEDHKLLYNKLTSYVHPAITQGKIVNESIQGKDFKFKNFIEKELTRGSNLIKYSLGKSRKVYWEEQQKYLCVGLIERKKTDLKKVSNLYTFSQDSQFRKGLVKFIPSYYVMAILPGYYENLVNETLSSFEIKSLNSNIRRIELGYRDLKVIYLEEFSFTKTSKNSLGLILIPVSDKEEIPEVKKLSYYRKKVRLILDQKKTLADKIDQINPEFSMKKWDILSEKGLNEIKEKLDN